MGWECSRSSWLDLDEVRRSIRETRRLTDRPFAVNLVLEWPQWERLEIALEEDVPVVHFHWGDQGEDPKPYLARLREAGVTVLYTTGSAAEARRAVDSGADVVVAQGWEAGGHVCGDVATLPLVPRVVDAVAPVPVLAAGGIGDGRGLAAALALGADGVWVGTRFLASEEAGLHDYYKERVVGAAETDTVHSTLFDIGWADAPHRTLRTSTVRAWEDAGRPAPGERPGEGEHVVTKASGAEVVRYANEEPVPGMTGDIEALAFFAGQSAGLVADILPAGEIVRRMVAEAEQTLRRLAER